MALLSSDAPAARAAAAPDPVGILSALGQAAFVWDLASDAMAWAGPVAALFEGLPQEAIARGADYARLIEPSQAIRNEAVSASVAGAPYRIEYALRASTTAAPCWVEETGGVLHDETGRPFRVEGVVRSIAERRARDEQLVRLSQHDALTGTLNRAHLLAALAAAIEDCARFRAQSAFLLIAVDHLAQVNDSFGFGVADEVIAATAQRLRARLRGGDQLGRFSGNKFGLVLKTCTAEDMRIAADRFLAGIREEVFATSGGAVAVTGSIGGVGLPRHARNADEAVGRAQESLDAARRRPGSFAAWRPSAARDNQRRVNIRVTDEIVTALNDRRIVVAFEPVVDARSRRVAFYECLVRMRQDDGGLLLAPDIVPAAEKLGLIRLVDHRVLELVVEQLATTPEIALSFNISPDTTLDPDWWSSAETLLGSRPDVARRLIVEITETVAIRDLDGVHDFVARLKAFGCRIAIDDFGAGYTSFRNLRKLGVDLVKIDGAFVQNIVTSADDRAFVQTLIDLARRLDIKTVAEWVQDDAAAALLQGWGCDFIQGRLTGLASPQRPWAAQAEATAAGFPAAG